MTRIDRHHITGLVLAGGRGSRMGGVDKGLQKHQGVPLAMHAMLRLAPQVGEVMINANRNLAAYESMGVPVWPDALSDYPGPLAGWLAGLEHCSTPTPRSRWLLAAGRARFSCNRCSVLSRRRCWSTWSPSCMPANAASPA